METEEMKALTKATQILRQSLGKIQPKDADVLVAEALGIIETILITNGYETHNQ